MKKLVVVLAALAGTVFLGQYLRNFAQVARDDQSSESINQENEPLDSSSSQTINNIMDNSSSNQEQKAVDDSVKVTQTILDMELTKVQSAELISSLKSIGIEGTLEEKGHPDSGLRKVIYATKPEIGLNFLEASYNVLSNGTEELGFLRYALDPSKHPQDGIRQELSDELGLNPQIVNGRQVWHLTNGLNVVLISDYSGEKPEQRGSLISFELEIY